MAAVGGSPEGLGLSFGLYRTAREEGGDAEGAAGPPLAVEAMALRDELRLARAGDLQLPAGTGRDSHGNPHG